MPNKVAGLLDDDSTSIADESDDKVESTSLLL